VFVFALSLLLSWAAHRRLDALLDRTDVRALEGSAKVLDTLVAQQQKHLKSAIAVLSEDTRIRAMVLTPFDQATVVDLLTDLKATSGASMVAMLDSGGTVRAVVGASEMDQLDLGTSTLIQSALEKPSAQLWIFANMVGVLSATAVRLDNQVRALFIMGFQVDSALLGDIQRSVGATGAIFVGDTIVASASKDREIERALRATAELPPGTYQIVAETFLGMSSRMSDSATAATVAWLVPLYRHAEEVTLTRALSWLPAALVGVLLAFMIGLALSQSRAGQNL
jgi:Double sensory domain of two-component sensor kinase